MTVGTVVCVGMAASTLVVDNAPWMLGVLCILLATYFAYGAVNRFWAVDIHERGLVWRHRRRRRQMPYTQVVSFQDTDTGVIIDGGDELFVLNALSYPIEHRAVMVEALRAVIPERETLATTSPVESEHKNKR